MIWFQVLWLQSGGCFSLKQKEKLFEAGQFCWNLIERSTLQESRHLKSLQQFKFCLVLCWGAWPTSFPTTGGIVCTKNDLRCISSDLRGAVFLYWFLRTQSPLLRPLILLTREHCGYKEWKFMKMGTFWRGRAFSQRCHHRTEICHCCPLQLDWPISNRCSSVLGLRKRSLCVHTLRKKKNWTFPLKTVSVAGVHDIWVEIWWIMLILRRLRFWVREERIKWANPSKRWLALAAYTT